MQERTCIARLLLTPAEYEHVRAQAETFLVLPEHVTRGVERVTEDHGHYVVVEKLGEAAEVARKTDPRA